MNLCKSGNQCNSLAISVSLWQSVAGNQCISFCNLCMSLLCLGDAQRSASPSRQRMQQAEFTDFPSPADAQREDTLHGMFLINKIFELTYYYLMHFYKTIIVIQSQNCSKCLLK